jgi:hypothetical protein
MMTTETKVSVGDIAADARFAAIEARITLAEQRAASAEARATAADQRVSGHEALCAFRYQGIIDRVVRVEHILLSTASVLLLGMASTIGMLFWRLPLGH